MLLFIGLNRITNQDQHLTVGTAPLIICQDMEFVSIASSIRIEKLFVAIINLKCSHYAFILYIIMCYNRKNKRIIYIQNMFNEV